MSVCHVLPQIMPNYEFTRGMVSLSALLDDLGFVSKSSSPQVPSPLSRDLSSCLIASLFNHHFFLPVWNVTHSGNRSSKTFKPKKNIPEGSHQYELLKHAEATLGSGNLRMAVMLPEGEDLNEWVAVNSKGQICLFLSLDKPLLAKVTLLKELIYLHTWLYFHVCQSFGSF